MDTSKLPEGSSYFTVQVGTYDTAKGTYLASELYRFNVTIESDYTPTITAQPQSVASERTSQNAILTVEASVSRGELSYQWYKVGETIDEKLSDGQASTNTYTVPMLTIGSNSYYCTVTNSIGGKTFICKSEIATVTVYGGWP